MIQHILLVESWLIIKDTHSAFRDWVRWVMHQIPIGHKCHKSVTNSKMGNDFNTTLFGMEKHTNLLLSCPLFNNFCQLLKIMGSRSINKSLGRTGIFDHVAIAVITLGTLSASLFPLMSMCAGTHHNSPIA